MADPGCPDQEAFLYLLLMAPVYSFFDRGLIENLLHTVNVW